jgi:hypothetical protein
VKCQQQLFVHCIAPYISKFVCQYDVIDIV